MRAVRRAWRSLRLSWQVGLRHLPFFTQRTAVLLVGVLVATLAMLGGVVTLVGWPGASGPTHLVPGERADRTPESRPAAGSAAPGGRSGTADRSGADAGGAAAALPSPAGGVRGTASAGGAGAGWSARQTMQPGGAATGAQGSGGAAGAGAGGPPAAPPTTTPPTTTTTRDPLDPVDDLLGPVVSTLLP